MRKLSLIILVIIILFGSLSCIRQKKHTYLYHSESKGFPFLISEGKLGTVSIGDGIDSTLRNLNLWFNVHDDSIPACEGCTEYSKIFRIYLGNGSLSQYIFSIEPGWEQDNMDKVFRITTSSEKIITESGIHVGMSVKDLKKASEITDVDINGDTGIHISIKDFNGSFGLEMPKSDEWLQFTPKTILDSLKITEIIII